MTAELQGNFSLELVYIIFLCFYSVILCAVQFRKIPSIPSVLAKAAHKPALYLKTYNKSMDAF